MRRATLSLDAHPTDPKADEIERDRRRRDHDPDAEGRAPLEPVGADAVAQIERVGLDVERGVAALGSVGVVGARLGGLCASLLGAVRTHGAAWYARIFTARHGPMGFPLHREPTGTLSPRMTSEAGPTVA